MLSSLKKFLYFPLSYYFRFFAKIKLSNWKPYIIVITGSSGKTTLLHLIESQLGDKARYSHHANSTYGIPFDILGISRKSLSILEWPTLFIKTPLSLFKNLSKQKIYVVETDCDRPNEGKYLASLLKPDITLWTNSTRTHSMNFDKLVRNGKFKTVEEAISYEFGYFLEYTKELAVINGDQENINKQLSRCNAEIIQIKISDLMSYRASLTEIEFKLNGESIKFKNLLPKQVFYSLSMCLKVLKHLNLPLDKSFAKFVLPPGRSIIFKGIKNTTLIDSSYNANLDSMKAVLQMFDSIVSDKKWVVVGDMLEQGESEREEHEKLSEILKKMKLDKIIFIGPRVLKYTYPKFSEKNIVGFTNPKDVLDYILENIKGEELILFKGARFLEGVIENLLIDKNDKEKLARREKVWEKRRKKFGL